MNGLLQWGILGLVAALLGSQTAPAQNTPRLIPVPRDAHWSAGPVPVSSFDLEEPSKPEDRSALEDLRDAFAARNIRTDRPNAWRVTLLRTSDERAARLLKEKSLTFEPAMAAEGYVLIAQPNQVSIVASSASGIFYGIQTLKQMVNANGTQTTVWTGTVRDWPAMRYRGVHDDLSRGPFPTLAFQEHQIKTLAAYKINVYTPYFEHTLQYDVDRLPAPPGSALTRQEARELVHFAARYHVMVVPEQEAFGHLHHVLKYEEFSDLAETPHGHVLAPGQKGTQPLIFSWFSQIAQDFPSPFLHIGADETFELGTGRTKADVASRGLGPVYADFLRDIHTTLAPLHRRLLFWGDVAWNDKSAIQRIPKDMIAIPWVYWHEDSYDANITPFRDAGIETWVAPGDANWRVMYPLGATALDNIQGFIESGQRLGATGALTAVWNDDGEGLFNQDWFGVLFGAAASWQPGKSDTAAYQQAFGLRFYNDPSGRVDEAQREIIAAEQLFNVSNDVFWIDPWSAAGQDVARKVRPHLAEARKHVERALELLLESQATSPNLHETAALRAMELGARRIDFAAMKFQLSDEMASAYQKANTLQNDPKRSTEVRELLYSISSMNGRCQDLRDGYSMLKNLYRDARLEENRPYWLDNVTVRYDLRIQLWQQRGEAIGTAIDHWQATKNFPSAADLGIPAVASN